MNPKAEFHDGKVYIPVLSFTEGAGEKFFASLGLESGVTAGEIDVNGKTAQVELIQLTGESHDGLESVIAKADAALMLIRFLDQASMTRIKEVFHLLHAEVFLPKAIATFREPKEAEFKISCSYCGQKLWVRDRDAGRRGNCPQCRKTFFVPTQKSYVTSFLMLTDAVPVMAVTGGDVSCRNAIASLFERVVSMAQGTKSSTMRIELPPEETAG